MHMHICIAEVRQKGAEYVYLYMYIYMCARVHRFTDISTCDYTYIHTSSRVWRQWQK